MDSFTLAGMPPLEIRDDLFFRDAFCFEHFLQAGGGFPQGCALGFAALACGGVRDR